MGKKLHKYRTSMSRHVRALWDDYVSEPDGCRLLGSRARRTKNFLVFSIVYLTSNTVIKNVRIETKGKVPIWGRGHPGQLNEEVEGLSI